MLSVSRGRLTPRLLLSWSGLFWSVLVFGAWLGAAVETRKLAPSSLNNLVSSSLEDEHVSCWSLRPADSLDSVLGDGSSSAASVITNTLIMIIILFDQQQHHVNVSVISVVV